MTKRLQNKVAESRLTLPLTAVYAAVVWIACGLLASEMWPQFICFVVSATLMVEINNSNALIRIYTRTVSSTFIVLSCATPALFTSLAGAIVQLCFIATLLLAFRTYQDYDAVGWTYYASLCLSIGSTVWVQALYFVPVMWLLMAFALMSLSWRTWAASIIGIITPYWFLAAWHIYDGSMNVMADHFRSLTLYIYPYDYSSVTVAQILVYAFVTVAAVTGTIHFLRQSHNDKIRIRQLYHFFMWMFLAAAAFLAVQPQHYDILIRMMIVCCSPLLAHFLSLTYTRITNVAFCLFTVVILLITAYNIWTL